MKPLLRISLCASVMVLLIGQFITVIPEKQATLERVLWTALAVCVASALGLILCRRKG